MYSEKYVDASTQVLKITKPFTSKPYSAAEGYLGHSMMSVLMDWLVCRSIVINQSRINQVLYQGWGYRQSSNPLPSIPFSLSPLTKCSLEKSSFNRSLVIQDIGLAIHLRHGIWVDGFEDSWCYIVGKFVFAWSSVLIGQSHIQKELCLLNKAIRKKKYLVRLQT